MPSAKDLTNIWKNIREFELSPIQKEALQELRIVLAGKPGAGRHTLAAQMRRDPNLPDSALVTNLPIVELQAVASPGQVDLLVLVVDGTAGNFDEERAVSRTWNNAGQKVLVILNKYDLVPEADRLRLSDPWDAAQALIGSVTDMRFLMERFVPAVLLLMPEKHLALGRQFPLFRVAIANQLINETCFSNAAYAFTTGIAEVVPVLGVPLNITDMIVLSKAQAFLVYRMGLLLGYSTRWQDYISEFGSVIGSGFVWRQLARQLVGLIPVWGIIPKVAVSYAGTYAVGHSVLQWYLTGRHLNRAQLNALYRQALAHGRDYAKALAGRLPRLRRKRLPAGQQPAALAAGQTLPSKKKKRGPLKCPSCSRLNSKNATFCQYCGQRLEEFPTPPPVSEIPLE